MINNKRHLSFHVMYNYNPSQGERPSVSMRQRSCSTSTLAYFIPRPHCSDQLRFGVRAADQGQCAGLEQRYSVIDFMAAGEGGGLQQQPMALQGLCLPPIREPRVKGCGSSLFHTHHDELHFVGRSASERQAAGRRYTTGNPAVAEQENKKNLIKPHISYKKSGFRSKQDFYLLL